LIERRYAGGGGPPFGSSVPALSARRKLVSISSSSVTRRPSSFWTAIRPSRKAAYAAGPKLAVELSLAQIRIRRVVGSIAGLVTGDQVLDLAARLALDLVEPLALGVAVDDARDLAHRRVADAPGRERLLALG
jgi:hypothetical protein